MGKEIRLLRGYSRVWAPTLDLLEDEERRCLDLSVLQCSVLRQMTFPWAKIPTRLVEDHGDYQIVVDMPTAYLEALEELEILLSGAYDGPVGGCPVGEEYINRSVGDAWDFTIGAGLTADNAYHYLDLRSVIDDVTATRVKITRYVVDNLINSNFNVKPFVESSDYSAQVLSTQAANTYNYDSHDIYMGTSLGIAYKITSGMNAAALTVLGWWRPAT